MPDPHRHRHSASVEWIILHGKTTWGIRELIDEIGNPSVVAEALEALQAAGLIERSGAFDGAHRHLCDTEVDSLCCRLPYPP